MYRETYSLHSAENSHSLQFLLKLKLLPSTSNKEPYHTYKETVKSFQWKGVFLAPNTLNVGVFLAPNTLNVESLTSNDNHFDSH